MKIEVLYPEICCLYGDKGNMRYLQLCLPEAEFIYTSLNDAPAFLEGDIDLCYLCSMSEASQELVLERLMPWQEKIASLMQNGRTLFLWVGNALEPNRNWRRHEPQNQARRDTHRRHYCHLPAGAPARRQSRLHTLSAEAPRRPLEKLPYEDAMRQAYAYKMKEMDNPDLKLF